MGAHQVVLQSFIPQKCRVNFRHLVDGADFKKGDPIKVKGVVKTVTLPSVFDAPKNILILTAEDFEAIREDVEPLLEQGQRGKGVVKLDDIPSGYWDPAQRIAEAEGKMNVAKQQAENAEFRVLELEEEVKSLKVKLIEYGWKE